MIKSIGIAALLAVCLSGSLAAQTTIGPTAVQGWLGFKPTTVSNLPTPTIAPSFASVNDGIDSTNGCTTGGGTTILLCQWTGLGWQPITGGGGGSPGGALYDVQLNAGGTFGSDTGIFTYNLTTHALSLPEVDVTGHSNGTVQWSHWNGSSFDFNYSEGLSSTFGATYGISPPDAAPTAVGQAMTVTSLTPVSGMLPTAWAASAVGYPAALYAALNPLTTTGGIAEAMAAAGANSAVVIDPGYTATMTTGVTVSNANVKILNYGEIAINGVVDAFTVNADGFTITGGGSINVTTTGDLTGKAMIRSNARFGVVDGLVVRGNAAAVNNGSFFRSSGNGFQANSWSFSNIDASNGAQPWESFIWIDNGVMTHTACCFAASNVVFSGTWSVGGLILDGFIDTFLMDRVVMVGAGTITGPAMWWRNTFYPTVHQGFPRWVRVTNSQLEAPGQVDLQIDAGRGNAYMDGYFASANNAVNFNGDVNFQAFSTTLDNNVLVNIAQDGFLFQNGNTLLTAITNNQMDDVCNTADNTYSTIVLPSSTSNGTLITNNIWRNVNNPNKCAYGVYSSAPTVQANVVISDNLIGYAQFGTSFTNLPNTTTYIAPITLQNDTTAQGFLTGQRGAGGGFGSKALIFNSSTTYTLTNCQVTAPDTVTLTTTTQAPQINTAEIIVFGTFSGTCSILNNFHLYATSSTTTSFVVNFPGATVGAADASGTTVYQFHTTTLTTDNQNNLFTSGFTTYQWLAGFSSNGLKIDAGGILRKVGAGGVDAAAIIGGGTISLDNVTGALADDAANSGDFQKTFQFHMTSNNRNGIAINESTASTGTNDSLLGTQTSATSTAFPARFCTHGSSDCVQMSAVGDLHAIGAATITATTSGLAGNLSGTPTLPTGTTIATPTAGNNSTGLATTAFVAKKWTYSNKTSTYTVTAADFDAQDGFYATGSTAFTFTLPASGGTMPITNECVSFNNGMTLGRGMTVAPGAGTTINGGSASLIFAKDRAVQVCSDGSTNYWTPGSKNAAVPNCGNVGTFAAGSTITLASAGANKAPGWGIILPQDCTFSNIGSVVGLQDAVTTNFYTLALADATASPALLCHTTAAQNATGTAPFTVVYACSEGAVTLPSGTYLLLGTGMATTARYWGAANSTSMGPYYNSNVSGFTATGGLITGTGSGVSQAFAIYTVGVPLFTLY